MFKVLILQSLYNLSADAVGFQILDRLSCKGESPGDWEAAKRCQKDVDARWTKKGGKTCYGYKNHICVDVKNKLIRSYAVTSASARDSNVFDELPDEIPTAAGMYMLIPRIELWNLSNSTMRKVTGRVSNAKAAAIKS